MLHLVSIVARVSVIVADTIVIVATWITLRHQVKESSDLNMGSRISATMLADGMLFFVVGAAKGDCSRREHVLHVSATFIRL